MIFTAGGSQGPPAVSQIVGDYTTYTDEAESAARSPCNTGSSAAITRRKRESEANMSVNSVFSVISLHGEPTACSQIRNMKPIRKHVCPAGDYSRRPHRRQSPGSASLMERRQGQEVHRRLCRQGDKGRLVRLRAGRRAHRDFRQRRHALGRAADVFPAHLRSRSREGARAASIRSGKQRSHLLRSSRAT